MLANVGMTANYHFSKKSKSRKLKIAVNTRFLLPRKLEGLGWYSHEVLRRLVHQRSQDEFFFLFDRPFDSSFLYANNVVPVVVPPPARHPVLWYGWFEWAVPRVLEKTKADVFFSPDSFCSLRSRVPTLMTVHDIIPLHRPEQVPFFPRIFYQKFLPKYIERAEQVVTISEFVKNDMVQTLGTPAAKIRVAHNGCRDVFQPLPDAEKLRVRQQFSEGKPYFFYAGSIHPRKNVHRLVAAFDLFRQKNPSANVNLLIGGRFLQATPEVQQQWRMAQHRHDIHFLGYLAEHDLARLTAAALALTYISLDEGFGLPLLEAMHCDVPVITSSVSSLPEVAGEAALLVEPTDVSAIAHALEIVFFDENMSKILVERGQQQRQKFSWDTTARIISDMLDDF